MKQHFKAITHAFIDTLMLEMRLEYFSVYRWMFLAFFLNYIELASLFDDHVSLVIKSDAIVLNASLGNGRKYDIDLAKYQQFPFVNFIYKTGMITLKITNISGQCTRGCPIMLQILSRNLHICRNINVTYAFPCFIFINNCNCKKFQQPRSKDTILHMITTNINNILSQHIPHFYKLVNVQEFIPKGFNKCNVFSNILSPNKFAFDNQTTLYATAELCFIQGCESINISLILICDVQQVLEIPFQIIVYYDFCERDDIPLKRVYRSVKSRLAFDNEHYIANVKEEQPPGIQVITVNATVLDMAVAGTLTYRLTTDSDIRSQNMFSIDPTTGIISTSVTLDREDMSVHHFVVFVTDPRFPVQSASAQLLIIVDDVNDYFPTFDEEVYNIELSENQPINTPVMSLRASDHDSDVNAVIRYDILNYARDENPFQLEPFTGDISTTTMLDREKSDSYRFVVQATDQGGYRYRKSSTATVLITILDENDNHPLFEKDMYEVKVEENNMVSVTKSLVQVKATDIDIGKNADIVYQLSGFGHERFIIDRTTGNISLRQQLDYEDQKKYSLMVRAEDKGRPPMRSSVHFLVEVIDVNDNTPYFPSLTVLGYIMENSDSGTIILQVHAFDSDDGLNSELCYFFVGIDDESSIPFEIDSKTGYVKSIGLVDREHKSVYSLDVTARDNGIPQRMGSTLVKIIVNDVNDNAPLFQMSTYDKYLSEDVRIGEEVLTIRADDLDQDENARVIYDIIGGNIAEKFQISQRNNKGLITVKNLLNARHQNEYVLSITATDIGGLKDAAQIRIHITDTNRNAPEFQGTPFHFFVLENTDIGTSVFKVKAIDQDRGENARITYTLDPDILAFSIDPNTGDIYTHFSLNREEKPSYRFSVTATDNGDPQKKDVEDIDVTIKDINDNKPQFLESMYNGYIKEYPESLPGDRVLQVSAIDIDDDYNRPVYYTFEGGNDGNGDFIIDNARGIIRIATGRFLDRERVANYELVAIAIDQGTPPLFSSVIVRIKVEDVNDNRPEFMSELLNVYIMENSPIDSTVAEITANDPDDGLFAIVDYTIDSGADAEYFQLSGRKGDPAIITTLIQDLDYESEKKLYRIVLRATSGTQFSTAKVFIHVRDVNDNVPVLNDFIIIYNNYPASFPEGSIGRIPAFDPDVSDQPLLNYAIISGNEAGILHINETTGEIRLDSRLNSDVPRTGNFVVTVSGIYFCIIHHVNVVFV